jgi:hypothetical protein
LIVSPCVEDDIGKSGRRAPCGARPPTPPDVLIVSGGFF